MSLCPTCVFDDFWHLESSHFSCCHRPAGLHGGCGHFPKGPNYLPPSSRGSSNHKHPVNTDLDSAGSKPCEGQRERSWWLKVPARQAYQTEFNPWNPEWKETAISPIVFCAHACVSMHTHTHFKDTTMLQGDSPAKLLLLFPSLASCSPQAPTGRAGSCLPTSRPLHPTFLADIPTLSHRHVPKEDPTPSFLGYLYQGLIASIKYRTVNLEFRVNNSFSVSTSHKCCIKGTKKVFLYLTC